MISMFSLKSSCERNSRPPPLDLKLSPTPPPGNWHFLVWHNDGFRVRAALDIASEAETISIVRARGKERSGNCSLTNPYQGYHEILESSQLGSQA